MNGWVAQSFVTGGTPDLDINSVSLLLGQAYNSPGEPLTVSLYSDDSSMPGSNLFNFTANTGGSSSSGSFVFSKPGGYFLNPGTEYWIVASTLHPPRRSRLLLGLHSLRFG